MLCVQATAVKIAASAFGDLGPPTLLFMIGVVTFTAGLAKLMSQPLVISPLAIALAWLAYGLIPHSLLLHRAFIRPGRSHVFWSR